MDYEKFQEILASAGTSINELADLVKMNRTSLYNYGIKGEVPSHIAVIAVLMRAMAASGVDYRVALADIEIAPKKPRGAGIGKFGGNK